jgi:hypothetical protein
MNQQRIQRQAARVLQFQTDVEHAKHIALQPWGKLPKDMVKARDILEKAGLTNLAASLQTFIDEPPLPLRVRRS